MMEIVTQTPPAPHGPPLRPNRVLLENQNSDDGYTRICVPLYNASITGDWATARNLIDKYRDLSLTGCGITQNNETALHVAVSRKSTKLTGVFVRSLVDNMTDEQLKFQDQNGHTALSLAAIAGNVKIARILVTRCRDLLIFPCGNGNVLPLYLAALYGRYDMVNYLYEESENLKDNFWNNEQRGWLLLKCLEADMYDIAKEIVTNRPQLAATPGVLEVLASKPNAFRDIEDKMIQRVIRPIRQYIALKIVTNRQQLAGTHGVPEVLASKPNAFRDAEYNMIQRVIIAIRQFTHVVKKERDATLVLRMLWRNIMSLSKDEIDRILRGPPDSELKDKEETTSQVLFIAAEMGNTKFIVELLRLYPDLVWKENGNRQSIFHVAVLHRQEGVYNLLYETGMMDPIGPMKDVDGNNMLHLAAMNIKNKRLPEISGVALQMQRELLWYKEVENMFPYSYIEKKNNAGLLPRELFTQDHKDLLSASEKWMKDTASQCMVVSALIATIVFAAAFTVPGGYNQDTGVPVFLHRKAFIVFVISDAISLIFATSSILMFLYILTSRYAEDDFLESLPKKLMRGLAALFLSIVAMMVAFSASFFVLYHNKLIWVPYVITVFCSLPVILYASHEYGLLIDIYNSTYRSKDLFRPKKPMLY